MIEQPSLICSYCGGDPLELNHASRCDGRQGGREDAGLLPWNYRAPFARGRETSEAAADSVTPNAGTLCAEILSEIQHCGTAGATCAEVEERFHLRHQTASARLWDLHTRGFIRDVGIRRATSSGRQAIAWVAA